MSDAAQVLDLNDALREARDMADVSKDVKKKKKVLAWVKRVQALAKPFQDHKALGDAFYDDETETIYDTFPSAILAVAASFILAINTHCLAPIFLKLKQNTTKQLSKKDQKSKEDWEKALANVVNGVQNWVTELDRSNSKTDQISGPLIYALFSLVTNESSKYLGGDVTSSILDSIEACLHVSKKAREDSKQCVTPAKLGTLLYNAHHCKDFGLVIDIVGSVFPARSPSRPEKIAFARGIFSHFEEAVANAAADLLLDTKASRWKADRLKLMLIISKNDLDRIQLYPLVAAKDPNGKDMVTNEDDIELRDAGRLMLYLDDQGIQVNLDESIGDLLVQYANISTARFSEADIEGAPHTTITVQLADGGDQYVFIVKAKKIDVQRACVARPFACKITLPSADKNSRHPGAVPAGQGGLAVPDAELPQPSSQPSATRSAERRSSQMAQLVDQISIGTNSISPEVVAAQQNAKAITSTVSTAPKQSALQKSAFGSTDSELSAAPSAVPTPIGKPPPKTSKSSNRINRPSTTPAATTSSTKKRPSPDAEDEEEDASNTKSKPKPASSKKRRTTPPKQKDDAMQVDVEPANDEVQDSTLVEPSRPYPPTVSKKSFSRKSVSRPASAASKKSVASNASSSKRAVGTIQTIDEGFDSLPGPSVAKQPVGLKAGAGKKGKAAPLAKGKTPVAKKMAPSTMSSSKKKPRGKEGAEPETSADSDEDDGTPPPKKASTSKVPTTRASASAKKKLTKAPQPIEDDHDEEEVLSPSKPRRGKRASAVAANARLIESPSESEEDGNDSRMGVEEPEAAPSPLPKHSKTIRRNVVVESIEEDEQEEDLAETVQKPVGKKTQVKAPQQPLHVSPPAIYDAADTFTPRPDALDIISRPATEYVASEEVGREDDPTEGMDAEVQRERSAPPEPSQSLEERPKPNAAKRLAKGAVYRDPDVLPPPAKSAVASKPKALGEKDPNVKPASIKSASTKSTKSVKGNERAVEEPTVSKSVTKPPSKSTQAPRKTDETRSTASTASSKKKEKQKAPWLAHEFIHPESNDQDAHDEAIQEDREEIDATIRGTVEKEEPIVESVQTLPSHIPGTQDTIESFAEGEEVDVGAEEEEGGDATFARDLSIRSHHFASTRNDEAVSAPLPIYTHPARPPGPAPPVIQPAYVLPPDQRVYTTQQHQSSSIQRNAPPSAGPSRRQSNAAPFQAPLHPFLLGESPPNDTSTPVAARRVQVLSQPQKIHQAPVLSSSAQAAPPVQAAPQPILAPQPTTSSSARKQPVTTHIAPSNYAAGLEDDPFAGPEPPRNARPSARATPAGPSKSLPVHAKQHLQRPVSGTSAIWRDRKAEEDNTTAQPQPQRRESRDGQKKKDKKRDAEEAGWATDNVEDIEEEAITGRGGRGIPARSARDSSAARASAKTTRQRPAPSSAHAPIANDPDYEDHRVYKEVFDQLSKHLYTKYVRNIGASKAEASKIHTRLEEEAHALVKHLHARSTTIFGQAQAHHQTFSEHSQKIQTNTDALRSSTRGCIEALREFGRQHQKRRDRIPKTFF